MFYLSETFENTIINGYKSDISYLLSKYYIDPRTFNKNGDTLLHLVLANAKCTQNERIQIMDIIIDQSADPNIKNDKQETVLHWAIAKKSKDIVNFLLTRGAKTDVIDNKGNTIAHFFIENLLECFANLERSIGNNAIFREEENIEEKKSASFVEWMVSKGFDFDLKNKKGQSALHLAIEYNLQHVLPFLFKYTNDINFVSERGKTLLHLFLNASIAANTRERGFYYREPSKTTKISQEILFYPNHRVHPSAFSRRYNIEIIQILLERGVTVDHVDEEGVTALNKAINSVVEMGIVQMLLNRFINIKDKCGNKLIHEVVKKSSLGNPRKDYYLNILHALTAKGVNVNCENECGMTPVYYAVQHRNLKFVKVLRDSGAHFNVITTDGQNLFHVLAKSTWDIRCTKKSSQYSLFDLLVQEGCDANAEDVSGRTPFYVAVESVNVAVIKELLAHGIDVNCHEKYENKTPLHLAVNQGHVQLTNLLLDHGANVNFKDHCEGRPLHIAAGRGYLRIAALLLERGADIDGGDNCGNRPLHLAVKKGYHEMVKFLLDNGANINSKGDYGERPLHLAATLTSNERWNCTSILQILLRKNPMVDARNNKGETALAKAIHHGHTGFIRALLANGANVNEKSVVQSVSACQTIRKRSLLENCIRLKAANLHCSIEYEKNLVEMNYDHFYLECWKEVKKLKEQLISDRTSLYEWLRMTTRRRYVHSHSVKFLDLVRSPTLQLEFPEYEIVIRGSFRKTLMRKSLLQPAKEAWLKLTEIYLPDICLECIFNYLSNGDLIDIIELTGEVRDCID